MDISLQDVRQALVDLGRLRFGEMSVHDAIREIVQTTHAIFDVDGAGLMLTDSDHNLRNVAASDDRFGHLEDLQIEHDEGPCIAAYEEKMLIGAEDLVRDARWPRFSQAALARNVRAVLASPLPYNQDAVGVVAVLSEQRHPWSAEGELALLAFTDLAALLIASMMQNEEKSELATQLQGALDTRKVIEQAKGVLMERQGITARTAYVLLRAQARAQRRKLGLICAEVVTSAGPHGRGRAGLTRLPVSTMLAHVFFPHFSGKTGRDRSRLTPDSHCRHRSSNDHPRYHSADYRVRREDRDPLDDRHHRAGNRAHPVPAGLDRPRDRRSPALLVAQRNGSGRHRRAGPPCTDPSRAGASFPQRLREARPSALALTRNRQ